MAHRLYDSPLPMSITEGHLKRSRKIPGPLSLGGFLSPL